MKKRPLWLIEDEPKVAATIERLLGDDWTVRRAGTVKEADRLFRGEPANAAIIDVTLPDGSGLDVLASLRGREPTMRVLVLTAHHEPGIINRAQTLGAEYACKPDFARNVRAFAERVLASERTLTSRERESVEAFAALHHLSYREEQVLRLAVAELPREAIAAELGISMNTLKTYVQTLLYKCRDASLSDLGRRVRARSREGG